MVFVLQKASWFLNWSLNPCIIHCTIICQVSQKRYPLKHLLSPRWPKRQTRGRSTRRRLLLTWCSRWLEWSAIVHRGKSLPFSQKSHKAKTLLNLPGSSSSCSGGKRPAGADGQDHDGQLRRWPGWGEQAHRRGGRNRRDFDTSVLVVYFWFRCLTLSISSSFIRGPRAEKKNLSEGLNIFFRCYPSWEACQLW